MKINKKKIGLIALALLLPLELSAQDFSDWRKPDNKELGSDYSWRKEDLNLYLTAKADFDGDGKTDTAALLINENKMGLFVTFASRKNIPALLLEATDKKEIRSMGIKAAKPDRYKTACGKGYWDCKKEEPEILNLKQPAIDFFTYESANSYFVWDKNTETFKRVWMSD
ncbi:MAG: hypothetical protein EPN25_11525 [Nitrospirae bacterium]|nr:MAG: hypothetical protein EPN25_11525 [Nitrospirota bacterium]